MAGIIDGSGSLGAAICQYVVSVVSDISLEIVFVILGSLLIVSALLLLPLSIRDIKEMYHNYWLVMEPEMEEPGGNGRDIAEHRKLRNNAEHSVSLTDSQGIDK